MDVTLHLTTSTGKTRVSHENTLQFHVDLQADCRGLFGALPRPRILSTTTTTHQPSPQHAVMGDSGVAIDRRRSSIINTKQKNRGTPHSQRIKTAIRSFRVLRGLTPAQVDAFLASYTIYSLDWSDEKTMVDTLGPDYQQKVGACLSDYYGVLNHLCAIGDLEKMYIPPAMDLSQSIVQNQILYEESIVDHLRLPPNAKVLDLGCGRGRVAAHISTLTGASVTGLSTFHPLL